MAKKSDSDQSAVSKLSADFIVKLKVIGIVDTILKVSGGDAFPILTDDMRQLLLPAMKASKLYLEEAVRVLFLNSLKHSSRL